MGKGIASISMLVNFFDKLKQLVTTYAAPIVAVLTIWSISFGSGLSGIDGLAYDYISRHPLKASEESNHKVLMVEVDYEAQNISNDNWINVISSLNKLGAKGIIFTFFPKEALAEFYQFVSQKPNIIFGRKTIPNSENLDQLILEPLPIAAENATIPFGVLHIPQNTDGIYRSQSLYTNVTEKSLPLLEVASAEKFYGKNLAFKDKTYLINFQGGEENLSKINIERILSNDLVSELVNNKVIIIGFIKKNNEIGLHTPATASNEMISPLAFHAFALDTLLNNNQIEQLNDFEKLALYAMIFLSVLGACTFFEIKVLILVNAGLTLLLIGFTVAALEYAYFWIPIIETLLIQYVLLLLFFRRKLALESKAIREAVINLSLELQERTYPDSFFNLKDHWSQVVVMIDQMFSFSRLIILERLSGDHRVQEVKALRCSLNDINEKRRDYEREPYLTCIKKNKPYIIQGYFNKQQPLSEIQYLVPLVFAGDVLGFLAFGIEEKIATLNENFETMIHKFSKEISELLYHAQAWKKLHKTSLSTWKNFKFFENESYFYNRLHQSITLLDKHLLVLENVINGLSTAIILYDLFGRALKLNASISTLLQSEGILPFKITALDLIVSISSKNYEEARQCLQDVVMHEKTFSFPARLLKTKNQKYVVRVYAIKHEKMHSKLGIKTSKTFVVSGILLELVNISSTLREQF